LLLLCIAVVAAGGLPLLLLLVTRCHCHIWREQLSSSKGGARASKERKQYHAEF